MPNFHSIVPNCHGARSASLLIALLALTPVPASPADPSFELIVRLRPSSTPPNRNARGVPAPVPARLSALVGDLHPGWRPAFPSRRPAARLVASASPDLSTVQVLRFSDLAARDAAAARLAADPDVIYVEPVFEILAPADEETRRVQPPADERSPARATITPGDSLYSLQWALPLIGMPEVWQSGTGTPGILVGIVDSGIDTGHFDLAPNVAKNALEAAGILDVDDDENGYIDDLLGWNVLDQSPDIEDGFGHGSHVAGIIGAAADGVRGTVGVTWEVGLLAVRMFNDGGRGTNLAGAQGIVYAADRGAHVINMSWGTARLSPLIRDAVDYASSAGAVLVASAGNGNTSVLDNFPAALDPVIAVGASAATGELANFSNRGPRIDLVAPGVDILSTLRGGHGQLSGTSMSAALVSGVVAHLLYRHPNLRAEEVRSILRLAAVDAGRSGWDPSFGAGRVNAAASLDQPAAPVAAIRRPRTLDGIAEPMFEVFADAEPASNSGGGTTFVLEMGEGSDPLKFGTLAEGEGGNASHLGVFDVAGHAETEVTLRLRVRDASGREAEDRVLIRVDRTAPVLVSRLHINRLAGRRFEQWVRYECNERVSGRVRARAAGSGADFMDLVSDEGAADHGANFTGLAHVFPGQHEYVIELRDLAGHESRFGAGEGGDPFVRDVLPLIDIPSDGFAAAVHLPGFELGIVADLDGDSRPELLGESRSDLDPRGTMTVLAAGSAWPHYEVRFQGPPGLPLAVGDVDGDSAPEVLLGDAYLGGEPGLSLFAGIASGDLRRLWKSDFGDRRGGGAIVDTDGDGDREILFAAIQESGELTLLEWRGGAMVPRELGFTMPTRTAGFAVADYDRDGQIEIALGSVYGELVVLEARGERFIETVREPFLGRTANAIVAADLGDADQDGRREFAISTVGTLAGRVERPAMAVLEAAGDDRYVVVSHVEFRDKNIPYDNWLAAGDVDADGRPELAVAQAGAVYLFAADRDDRFLPVWYAERAGGGRVFVADLDGDREAEILISARAAGSPVTTIYSRRGARFGLPLTWSAVLHPLGNEIRWEAPAGGVRVFDLAIYRLAEAAASGKDALGGLLLESDLADLRITDRPGELVAADFFRDLKAEGVWQYALAYTMDTGKSRQRVLDRAQAPVTSPGVPLVLVHPNPATPENVAISLALSEPGPVRIAIVDVAGRVRRELLAGPLAIGHHHLTLDVRGTGRGQPLARGLYFVRVQLPHSEHTARLVLLR